MRLLVVIISLLSTLCLATCDYWSERDSFIKDEEAEMIGSGILLSEDEQKVNDILMSYKSQEFDEAFIDPIKFLPAEHFFTAREKIEQSEVFKFIRRLPKGGLLHTHDTALSSFDVLYNLTYKENLYACDGENDKIKLKFFKTPDNSCQWELVSDLRAKNGTFDCYLKSKLTLIVDNPRIVHTDINTVWSIFGDIFGLVTPFVTYKPVFEEYFYKVLEELHDDNVMYLEFRGTLPEVYDLDGKIYSPLEVVQIYRDVVEVFRKDYPECMGVGLIYAPVRKVSNETVDQYIEIARELIKHHSDFVVGFDLVGQEDLGNPLSSYINQLLSIQNETHFFFHAGETNWYGAPTDQNLIDAVLLGTVRIGHGYALSKHPAVLREIKLKEIGIEISPISNQVLLLVEDMRNHPGAALIAQGYPVVICNDDPTYWGARALSYDWYMAFMGMASRSADLRMLKQFALNSLKYSAMEKESKRIAIVEWHKLWNVFVADMLARQEGGVVTMV